MAELLISMNLADLSQVWWFSASLIAENGSGWVGIDL